MKQLFLSFLESAVIKMPRGEKWGLNNKKELMLKMALAPLQLSRSETDR